MLSRTLRRPRGTVRLSLSLSLSLCHKFGISIEAFPPRRAGATFTLKGTILRRRGRISSEGYKFRASPSPAHCRKPGRAIIIVIIVTVPFPLRNHFSPLSSAKERIWRKTLRRCYLLHDRGLGREGGPGRPHARGGMANEALKQLTANHASSSFSLSLFRSPPSFVIAS